MHVENTEIQTQKMKGFGILRWDYADDHGDLHERVGFVRKFWGEVREMPWKQAESQKQQIS